MRCKIKASAEEATMDLLLTILKQGGVSPTLVSVKRDFVVVENISPFLQESLDGLGYIVTEDQQCFAESEMLNFAEMFGYYQSQPSEIQEMVRDMVAIINDKKATPEDCKSASYTLQEVFYGERG